MKKMQVLLTIAICAALAGASWAEAVDGRTWFSGSHYNYDSYKWNIGKLWDSYKIAGGGGVATFGGETFKGFDQNVSGLVLRGLDFASCAPGKYNNSYGDYLCGYDITMTNAAFLSSDCVSFAHPQLVSLVLKGTGANTLTRRGLGSIALVKPVKDFEKLSIRDGVTFADAVSGKVFTSDDTKLELAGGVANVRATGDVALGGDLIAGVGAGLLAVPSANLTVPRLSAADGGSAIISNGTGKITVTESPADAKGRVDPRFVMRDWSSYGAPFRFLKYDATNGLQPIGTDDALVKPLAEAGADDIACVTTDTSAATYSLTESKQVKALIVDNRANLAIADGCTLTVGDGTNPAGVIFSEKETGSNYTVFEGAGTLDFGNSHGVIWKSTPTDAKGRGVAIKTKITGSKGVTFTSRSTGKKDVYALFCGYVEAGWTGPTYFSNCRYDPSINDKSCLPSGGEVYFLGNRQPYGAQLFTNTDTYDQHLHFSGYGPYGALGNGSDGFGVIYMANSGTSLYTSTFNGTVTLEDESLFFLDSAYTAAVFNGIVDGPGKLLITGAGTVSLNNAANAFSGGLVLTNYMGNAAPTVSVASLGALGAGPVTVLGGQIKLAKNASGTFTNAFAHLSSSALPVESSAIGFEGPTTIANAKMDTDLTTKVCTTIGVGDTLSLGRVSWASPSGTGEVYATSSAALLKIGDATDSTLSVPMTDGTGKLSLTKTGSGTVTLVGAKTYTGTTSVEAGTLRLEGDILDSPSIVYWLDASKPETIDVDGDGHVTSWRSVKGDYTFAAATISSTVYPTPTYTREKKINDLDVVTFNNVDQDDREAIAGTTDVTQRSVFIVTRVNQVPYRFAGLFGRMGADNGLRANSAASGTGASSWNHTDSTYKYNTDGIIYKNGVKGVDNTDFKCGEVQILTQFHAYDQNSGAYSYATFRPSLGVYSNASTSDSSYNRAIGADICEVIAFDRVLTTAERQCVENYLAKKWKGAACHANPETYVTMATDGFNLMPGATLDLHGGDITVSALSGEGTITNSSEIAATLRVTGASTFAGKIVGNVKLVTGGSAALKVAMAADTTLAIESGTANVSAYAETIPTDSLAYWLDAGVASTVITDDEGHVTNWQSRATSTASGFEYTSQTVLSTYASTVPHAYEPTGLNGKPAVHFTATTEIMKSTAKVHTRTFFLVGKLDGTQMNMGAPWGIWGEDIEYRFDGATTCGKLNALSMITPACAGDTLHLNGVNIPLVAMTTYYNLGTDVYMIAFRVSDAHTDLETNRYYNYHGLNRNCQDRGAKQWLGEVICYERALTDDEFAAVESYLKRKWFAGTGAFPETPAVMADGATLSVTGGATANVAGGLTLASLANDGTGGTLNGDVTLNGLFTVDGHDQTLLSPLTIAGQLTLGSSAAAKIQNCGNLSREDHCALKATSVSGEFSSVTGVPGRFQWFRDGSSWKLIKSGTMILFY